MGVYILIEMHGSLSLAKRVVACVEKYNAGACGGHESSTITQATGWGRMQWNSEQNIIYCVCLASQLSWS